MKRAFLLLPLLVVLVSGCAGDPLAPIHTENVLPGTAHEYSVGSEDYPYADGWFDEVNTGNLTVSENATFSGGIELEGDGRVWLEFRADIDFESVRAHGTPTWVTRGVFGGFSLPVFADDDEELQFEVCVPDRWNGVAWELLGSVGEEPGGMAVYEGNLYIPCDVDDNVWVYDGTDLAVSGDVGDAPVYSFVYDDDLYVTCSGDDTVWVYDGTSWALSGNVGSSPEGMAELDGDLYVACRLDDKIWAFDGTIWAVDTALGAGGVAGAVGTSPLYLAEYGGDLYVGCGGIDDDVWIRTGGVWEKDDDVDGNPQEFHEHDGDLYLNCYTDDTVWARSGGVWAVVTNVMVDIGGDPVGLEEHEGDLFSACMNDVWADTEGFWNIEADFSRVTADEPMFLKEYDGALYCSCNDGDTIWVFSGSTAEVHIHCWLSAAQTVATDAFRLYLEFETFTPGEDVVPIIGEDIVVEILTGVVAQYQSYNVVFPIDMIGVEGDDSLGFRLQRIASSDEIAGEVVIQHVGLVVLCDKVGSPTPD